MTILTMDNRKTLIKEILNQYPDTTLIKSIRKSGDTSLNDYLSTIRLDVIDSLGDLNEVGLVEQDMMIDLYDKMNDEQLAAVHRQDMLDKLENWCSTTGECDLFDSLTIRDRLYTTGVAMTAAKQIISTSNTNAINGFLTGPQTLITDAIKTEITSNTATSYGTWLAIGAFTALTALGFMFAYRNELRRGYSSLKTSIDRCLFGYSPKVHDINDYELSEALHRL